MDIHVIASPEKTGVPSTGTELICIPGGMVKDCLRLGFGVKAIRVVKGSPEVVGPDQLHQLIYDLRKLIIQFLSQKSGEKGDSFEQALHIRIRSGASKHRARAGWALENSLPSSFRWDNSS